MFKPDASESNQNIIHCLELEFASKFLKVVNELVFDVKIFMNDDMVPRDKWSDHNVNIKSQQGCYIIHHWEQWN